MLYVTDADPSPKYFCFVRCFVWQMLILVQPSNTNIQMMLVREGYFTHKQSQIIFMPPE